VQIADFERWRQHFLEAGEQALDPEAAGQATNSEVLRDLHAQIGAQAMEIQTLKKRLAGFSGG
jgi:hypothetical protein